MTYSSKKLRTRHYKDEHRDIQSQFDHSLVGESLNLGAKNVAQIAFVLANGTQEVKDLLLNECNIIYECRQCRNLFRSFANLITHKRAYCKGHQCEQMLLYDSSWYVPEKEKLKNEDDEKVKVIPEIEVKNESIDQKTNSITNKTDNKTTFELKRKSLHSIVNSLQKDAQNDSVTATPSQTSIQQSTTEQLNTETSTQKSSSETILPSKKSSSEDIINPSILKASSLSDHKEKVEFMNESLLSTNESSSSSSKTTAATSVTPTQIVRKNKLKPNLILKRESMPIVVQKSHCPVQICTKKRYKPDIKSNGNDAHERPISLQSCIPIEVITIE